MRDPQTQTVYAVGNEPSLFLGRGYTGHEHLSMFGLINMNARLYDPVLGRFLAPDPYVQMIDFSQNFNRYAYCVNNPLLYMDENGEWFLIDDIIAAVVGGVINVVTNIGHIQNFGHGLSLFGVGAAAGLVSIYGSPLAGAAVLSVSNNVLNQGFTKGWNNIDFDQTAMSGLMGMATSVIGGQLSSKFAPGIDKLTSNISSPVAKGMISEGLTNASAGFVLSTGMAVGRGEDIGDALRSGGQGFASGFAIGSISGMASGLQYARDNGLNPWNGNERVTVTAKDLGLSGTIDRIKSGESYPHRNDGSTFHNNKDILPVHKDGYYKEYVHPTPSINHAEAQRIIIGKGGEYYYSPDHYKTFIRFK